MTATEQAPARTSRRRATFHRLRVATVERLTEDSVAITFAVPAELREAYRFTQGQHVSVRRPADQGGDDVRRSYSICAPATTGPLRIAVKRLPGGIFSEWASGGLAVGDELEVLTPVGRFFTPLDPANAKHYAAVAAGSGITPVLSIVATTLEVEPASRVTLVYGNRSSRSVMFLEELEDLKDRYPERFHLLHVLSREQQDAALLTGRIDADKVRALLASVLPPDTVDEWFLCGPYGMVMAAREVLLEQGVDRRHVHSELFHVGDTAPPVRLVTAGAEPASTSTVTVVLDGRRTTLELASDAEAVLDAVLQVRADAPYACRGGVCGTCRAKVVEGSVEMDRVYALEEEEIERGYVLTCQSHPRTPRVVLDFDA